MKYPFMPMFWGDFFANTLHLSAQELGAYICLIGHAWERGGWIGYDQAQRIARVDNRHWQKVRETLEPFFEVDRDAKGLPRRYYHGRVLRELAKAAEISKKRKAAAEQMLSKRSANAQQTMQQNASKIPSTKKKENPSFFLNAARETESSKEKSPRSLATALPSGALTRSAETEDEEAKKATEKKPEDLTLAEINAIAFGAKR